MNLLIFRCCKERLYFLDNVLSASYQSKQGVRLFQNNTNFVSRNCIITLNLFPMSIPIFPKLCVVACLLGSSLSALAQTPEDFVQWSATQKLNVSDFVIKPKTNQQVYATAQFTIEYQVKGLDFLARNFNKKVRALLVKSASSIDTSYNVAQTLTYQQTLFDLLEIYTRQFRKALKDNKSKLSKGTAIAEELNKKVMADFAKRKALYEAETNFGTSPSQQKAWESVILQELFILDRYAFER